MIIYHADNTIAYEFSSYNEGSTLVKKLMSDDYVTLTFVMSNPVEFCIGDYIDITLGEGDAIFRRYVVVDKYYPTYNINTGAYQYELKMEADYMGWKNKIVKYNPVTGGDELSFSLTSTIAVHGNIIKSNLEALGFTFNGVTYDVSYDNTIDLAVAKAVQYDSLNIIDALTKIAQTFGCEWWVSNNSIYFGKNQKPYSVDEVVFRMGDNISDMTKSDGKDFPATRVYVFGSEKNLPRSYKMSNNPDLTRSAIVQKRLMLPTISEITQEALNALDEIGYELTDGGYVQEKGTNNDTAIETVIVDDNVYPKTECIISDIETYEDTATNDDGTTTTTTFYRLYDGSNFVFSEDMILEGQTLHILFQSGSMNGMDFECQYNEEKKYYEVVANETYGRLLPDPVLCPEIGDKFVIYNWDSSLVESTNLIKTASNELVKSAIKFIEKSKIDPNSYTCTEECYEDSFLIREIGDRVMLYNEAYFKEGRHSRITGIEIKLDIPYDHPKYTVAESVDYVYTSHQDNTDELTFNGRSYEGVSLSGSSIYLIKYRDRTMASDDNTYSAKRIDYELRKRLSNTEDDVAQGVINFLSSLLIDSVPIEDIFLGKRKEDTTNYLLNLLGGAVIKYGIRSDIFQSGLQDGYGMALVERDGKWVIEVDDLMVRGTMSVHTLEVKKKSYTAGNLSLGNAGNTIFKVVPVTYGTPVGFSVFAIPVKENGVVTGYTIISAKRTGDSYDIVASSEQDVNSLYGESSNVTGFKCYFYIDDKHKQVSNDWQVGDMAKCRVWNIAEGTSEKYQNRYYWRLVTEVGIEEINGYNCGYVVLSNQYEKISLRVNEGTEDEPEWHEFQAWGAMTGSSVPAAGDDIVQEGNPYNKNRQGLITLDVSEMSAAQPKSCKFDMYEGLGADTTSAATQYSYSAANNPVHISPDDVHFDVDRLRIRTGSGVNPVNAYKGTWEPGMIAYHNEEWSYEGSTFVCVTTNPSGTKDVPSNESEDWEMKVSKGTNVQGEATGHYTNYTALQKDIKDGTISPEIDDKFLVEDSSDYYEIYEERELRGKAVPTLMVYISAPDFAWHVKYPEYNDAYIVNGYLWVAKKTMWINVGLFQGHDGGDGISFRTDPTTVIVTERRSENSVSYAFPQYVYVKANIGGDDRDATISDVVSDCLTVRKTVVNKTNAIQIDGVKSDYGSDGKYKDVTTGSITVNGSCNDIGFTLSISVYFNRLGQLAVTIQNDTISEVASQLEYGYDNPDAKQVDAIQHMGQFIRSSSENISQIQQTRARRNLFELSGDTTAWIKNDNGYPLADFEAENYRFYDSGATNDIYSPAMTLEAGTYCFSAYCPKGRDFDVYGTTICLVAGVTDSNPGGNIYINASEVGTVKGETMRINDVVYERKYAVFDLDKDSTCRVNVWSGPDEANVAFPVFVEGRAPSLVSTDTSVIKQTASNLELSIRNKLGETGIKINGDNRVIDLSAAKVVMSDGGEGQTIVEGGQIKAGYIEADNLQTRHLFATDNETYVKIDPGLFELGVCVSEDGVFAQHKAFSLGLNDKKEAVLRYYAPDGMLIGIIDASFFSAQAYGNTWTPLKVRKVSAAVKIPTFMEARAVAIGTTAAHTYYRFDEGYVLYEDAETKAKTRHYNVSGSTSPSVANNKYFRYLLGESTLIKSYISGGTLANYYMEDGWYIAPDAKPYQSLTKYLQRDVEIIEGNNNGYTLIGDDGNSEEFYPLYRCQDGIVYHAQSIGSAGSEPGLLPIL